MKSVINNMNNECFRAFLSNISVKDLNNPNLEKVAENFQEEYQYQLKQKHLVATSVDMKQH